MQLARDPETTIADMEKAILRECTATITYVDDDGVETVRTIEPYEIYPPKNSPEPLVRALCRARDGQPRFFRPESIRSYTIHRRARRLMDHSIYAPAA